LATLADIGLAAVLNLFFIYRYTGYVFCFADLLKNSGAALILAAILYLGYSPLQELLGNRFFAMGLISGVGGLVYVGAMLCCGGLTRRDLGRLPFIGSRLAKDEDGGIRRI
jgi:stage V sporulation protein B